MKNLMFVLKSMKNEKLIQERILIHYHMILETNVVNRVSTNPYVE